MSEKQKTSSGRRGIITTISLSASFYAARFSTVLINISRLPGFVGLVPPPALDKKTIYLILHSFTKFTMDYDSILVFCQLK